MTKSSNSKLRRPLTTGIGSLPFRETSASLNSAFSVDLPYFPTLPQRDPREGMLAAVLEGFPGVRLREAEVNWDAAAWAEERKLFEERLAEALNRNRYLDFLPAVFLSRWEDFCRWLGEHPSARAKSQVTGLFTASRAMRGLQELPLPKQEKVLQALADFIFARAMAMAAGIRLAERQPLIFFDEPAWPSWDPRNPSDHFLAGKFRELLEDLKNAGVQTGIHCCGRANFSTWLTWDFDYLSLDCDISLEDLLREEGALQSWLNAGGALSLGVVPTALPAGWDVRQEAKKLLERFPEGVKAAVFQSCLLTPACGLGLRSPGETESVFKALAEFTKIIQDAAL
jgi:hypothetical protein